VRPAVPVVTTPGVACSNPIDCVHRRPACGKGPCTFAGGHPRTLARRLYLILHGLPAHAPQVEAFVPTRGRRYEPAREELLASPAPYGERGPRHGSTEPFRRTPGFG